MIFVTVGTHEQSFDRLIKEIDNLKGQNIIKEEIFIQTGYSEYEPKNCRWSKLLSYDEMSKKINNARIVITHGGPASFLAPLQLGKIPIVVPRQYKYNEHVNDHQLDFARKVKERQKNIILVEDINELKDIILKYDEEIKKINKKNTSNNKKFCDEFKKIVNELFK